jgi:hypothetical protein
MRGWSALVGALLLAASAPALAAEPPPICADRPGKATGTCLVAAGHWQLETGVADWSVQKDGGARDTSLSIGETTIKYGLTESSNIEVDVVPWESAHSRGPGSHEGASGFGDVNLLLKQRLTSADAPVQVDLLPLVKVPVAKHSLGNGKWEGALLMPVGFAIPGTPLSIGLTPEADWIADGDGHGHHAGMAQVASLGWQATDKLNLSAEIWGGWDWDPDGTTRQASADAAAAYLLSNDVQLDAGANFGLNRNTPDVEIYGGVSVRF